jgi:8-oxo-dGTP pyrophosphatase MutT (NUDIX family)
VATRIDRPSARVVVIDETGHVLLFKIDDPQDARPAIWITPGGGIEPGESVVAAACRELFEETGRQTTNGALGAPIAVCRGDWEFRGVPLHSVDWFFGLRTTRFEPEVDGYSDLEREIQGEARWWHPDELDTTEELTLPAGLAELARAVAREAHPSEPVELPWLAV